MVIEYKKNGLLIHIISCISITYSFEIKAYCRYRGHRFTELELI
jgi:hypothetical protein